MTKEKKRLLITAGRRVVFAGLIILIAWLLIFGLRGTYTPVLVESMAEIAQSQKYNEKYSLEETEEILEEWIDETEWSVSFSADEPVADMISKRMGYTAQTLVLTALMSLGIAVLLLSIGAVISRLTERPVLLARIRQVLRMLFISGGISMPTQWVSIILIVYSVAWFSQSTNSTTSEISWQSIFVVALLPAWLLVQTGHGELMKISESGWLTVRHLCIKLITTLLKLTGAIIAITMLGFGVFGLGRLIVSSIAMRDFPVVFEIFWILLVIIVIAKLIAELIEIGYRLFCQQPVLIEKSIEPESQKISIPKGWLIFTLVLLLIVVIVVFVAPIFAHYPPNEIHLVDRLQPSSEKYRLGTDQMGRDILSQLLYAAKNDLRFGIVCVGIAGVVATLWALLAAYLRKTDNWTGDTLEDVVMLPRDIACAFPWPLLILLPMSILERSNATLIVVTGMVLLPHLAGMMKEAYTSPSEDIGWLHPVLWSIPVMLLYATAGAIIYISAISYIGFGVPPGTPELSAMLSQEGRKYMELMPQLSIYPGLVLSLLIFVWVLAGNTLLEYLGFRSRSVWLKVFE